MRFDQYNNPIPDDLVLLPDIENLSEEDVEIVDNARWYEADGVLVASAKEINYLSEDGPEDAGVNIEETEILYIAACLHRYEEEGFYHA